MSALPLKLIVGLGNPGSEYARTRHNAGFWLLDELARRHGATFRNESRYHAEVARARVGGDELWLLEADELHEPQRRSCAQPGGVLQGAGRVDPRRL